MDNFGTMWTSVVYISHSFGFIIQMTSSTIWANDLSLGTEKNV